MQEKKVWMEQTSEQSTAKKKCSKVGLVLVQSACCVVLVVLFWLFKVLGGESFAALKTAFYNALENNVLMETVVDVFSERPADNTAITTPTADE